MKIKVDMDKEFKRFARNVEKITAMTTLEMKDIVSYNGKQFIKRAIKFTPLMRKNQPRWIPVSSFDPATRSTFISAGIISADSKWIKASALGLTPYTPKGRGFARSGWLKAAQGLKAMNANYTQYMGKYSRSFGLFRDELKRMVPRVTVGNKIPFIEDLDRGSTTNREAAHILARAMAKTNRDMQRKIEYYKRKNSMLWAKR